MKCLRFANGAEASDNIDKICVGEYVMPLSPPAPTHRATQLLPNTQQLGGEGYITSSRAGITHFVQRLAIIL